MLKLLGLSFLTLCACATASGADAAEVLITHTYSLTVVAHCEEGEVGCSDLTATLVDRTTGRRTELAGSTYMVKCADRVTPCHAGFYELASPAAEVRAYPDGTLELKLESGKTHERGTWQ